MPWTCVACETVVSDDEMVCPQCEVAKTHWTMQVDKTRTFRLSARKLTCYRGDGSQPQPAGEAGEVVYTKTRAAVVLDKELARELSAAGQLPATRDLLFVRLTPRGYEDLSVTLTINFAQADEVEHTAEQSLSAEELVNEAGWFHNVYCFVYGEGDASEIQFPGVYVVDVGEDTERGFAPTLEVRGLRKPPQELETTKAGCGLQLTDERGAPLPWIDFQWIGESGPLEVGRFDAQGWAEPEAAGRGALRVALTGPGYLSAQFFDRGGRRVAARQPFRAGDLEGQTDDQGIALLPNQPAGEVVLTFAEGEVAVPVVNDPDALCFVPLPFLDLERREPALGRPAPTPPPAPPEDEQPPSEDPHYEPQRVDEAEEAP